MVVKVYSPGHLRDQTKAQTVCKRVEISVVGVYEKGYENLLDFGLYKGSKGLTDSFYGWE